MNRSFSDRISRGISVGLAFGTFALCCVAWAQVEPAAPPLAQPVARVGTPSFLGAVDLTLRLWSGQFQKLNIYALIGLMLFAAYVTGLIVFQILFASGTFAPRAASVGAWFGVLVLLFFGLMMLPLTWPWWAPYAFLFGGLLMSAVLISSLSKKAA